MLCLNSTEAERARGCVFSENFESPTHVAKNRGTVTGTVPINFGATFPGVDANYLSYPCGSLLNKPVVTIACEIIPYFAANDGLNHLLVDSTNGLRTIISKTAAGTIQVYMGATTLVLDIPLVTFSPYWYQNRRNVFVATCFTANNAAYLNGVSMGTSNTAWTPADPTTLYLGSTFGGVNTFSGKYLSCKIFTGRVAADLLTLQEARDYYQAG